MRISCSLASKSPMQGLSKEILGRRERIKLSRTKSNEVSAVGDFDLSQAQEANLVDSSAAGAFVHGLEDEYFEVRMATIDSMCELSSRSKIFAEKSIDFLVDMFNDEIDAVRRNSIHSLRKIADQFQLREEQLYVVLSALEDASATTRTAVHLLMAAIRLATIQSTLTVVQALLTNLQRYPSDRQSIYQSLRGLGHNHAHFLDFLLEDLLKIDPRFQSMEPNPDDPYYTAVMIVILNAVRVSPALFPLLPSYAHRHYSYLKDKYPSCFPLLEFVDSSSTWSSSSHTSDSTQAMQVDQLMMTTTAGSGGGYEIDEYFVRSWQFIRTQLNDPTAAGRFDALFHSLNRSVTA